MCCSLIHISLMSFFHYFLDSMPADISFTPNRSIGNSSYQHHPHHLHHHSHGPESPTTPNMFTLPSTFSYVPSMAIQPNLVASESPAGPAKSTMTTPATMITSSTSISRDSAAIPAKMLVTHNSSSGQVVTSLANES